MAKNAKQIILDTILDAMKGGQTPLVKDFAKCDIFEGENCYINEPRNYATNRAYTGINRILPAGYYLTFKQICDFNAKLNKGAKSYMVIACYPCEMVTYTYVDENGENHTKTMTKKSFDEKKPEFIEKKEWCRWSEPRYFKVFNINDCTGLPKLKWQNSLAKSKERVWIKPDKADPLIEQIVDYLMDEKLKVKHSSKDKIQSSYYDLANDEVVMMYYDKYEDMVEYYHQLFHELGHATGAESRLNRKSLKQNDGFGGEQYSLEECTVETAATIICNKLNILTNNGLNRNKEYIAGWYSKLKEYRGDTAKALMQIFSNAEKIVDYLMSE